MVRPNDRCPEVATLKAATAGLTYPSESDESFDVFCWETARPTSAREQIVAREKPGRVIQEQDVNDFFGALDDADERDRYRALRRAIESQLSGVQVFRVGVGEPRVDVYLIGRTRYGDWAGLHTVSVET